MLSGNLDFLGIYGVCLVVGFGDAAMSVLAGAMGRGCSSLGNLDSFVVEVRCFGTWPIFCIGTVVAMEILLLCLYCWNYFDCGNWG